MTPPVLLAAPPVERGYKLLAQGLVIQRALTMDEWRILGRQLIEVYNRTNWAIGDWLIYGTVQGDSYEDMYVEASRITNRSFASLTQVCRVSLAFPLERREAAVPWSFYRSSLRLPDAAERVRALTLAASNKWTGDDFTNYINSRGVDAVVDVQADPSPARSEGARSAVAKRWKDWLLAPQRRKRSVICPHCGHEFESGRSLRRKAIDAEPVAVAAVREDSR